jgi:hypothetical protein
LTRLGDASPPAERGATNNRLATFWHGPLHPIAFGCLASFASMGVALRLYSYDETIEAPRGVEVANARMICRDETLVHRYLAGGKPSLASFADRFRYQMIRQTGECWVDADMVCLDKPDFSSDAFVFGLQSNPYGELLINNAVLRLPPDHPVLTALIERALAGVDVDQSWGAIGPFLWTTIAAEGGIASAARKSSDFYPIEPDDFWKFLLPAYRDEVAAIVKRSTFLHLWSEMFGRSGYDKSACPPAGSFLHEAFERVGTLNRFSRIYQERELVGIIERWSAREDAATPAAGSS